MTNNDKPEKKESRNFIKNIIDRDLETGKNGKRVHTRFPPEPNGYLHIGHAKAICLNFGISNEYPGAMCNLRFDDTNPSKEETEYVKSIQEDVRWLGYDWEDRLFFASDYFEKLYQFAIELVEQGKAYVCDLTGDEMRRYRGTLTEPGQESPYRNRSIEENLDLFQRMKKGEFEDGTRTLRAKIDMSSPNLNMRDPVIYRIMRTHHHRTGDDWVIYPMYDFTHGLSDALEGITHSICTLEFEDHRPLYDWFIENVSAPCHPQQIEFARLNLTHTVMSKRKLLNLVKTKIVDGWDDPRMPTITGLRRRGFTSASIRDFCDRIGVAKADSTVDIALLNHCLREDLNKHAARVMAVMDPLKVVITNYPEDKEEMLKAENNPEDPNSGHREMPFSRVVYIEQDDFREDPPRKYFRLSPGKEIRLKHAYYITCTDVIKGDDGEILEVHCTYDPATRGGWSDDGRKVKGTSHWVSAKHALNAEVRIYDHLFTESDPEVGEGYLENINPDSVTILKDSKVEPSLDQSKPGDRFQFLRRGYFCRDLKSSGLVFNRTVGLRDTWAKKANKA